MPANDFYSYYREVLSLNEQDYNNFVTSAQTPLPSCFRVTENSDSHLILQKLAKYPFLNKIEYLKNVFTFDLKERTPLYKEFIQFLVAQSDIGNIQRQEIVSMLPHMLMDLKTEHNVFETCAAPGSKTKQILEVVKEGLVVSNDKSVSRSNILVCEALKKSSSNFLVTRVDATQFPNTSILFDRICCDVPCSSDGTIRKSPCILDTWSIQTSIGLCKLQFGILNRAAELLADNGLLVYSTCSLNPIENENVVNKLLQTNKYELVDSKLKGIIFRKGISAFKHQNIEFNNPVLEKCIRIMPQDQNTGGFFIAVIKRKEKNIIKPVEDLKSLSKEFSNVPDEIKEILKSKYNHDISKDHLISTTEKCKNIFAVSDKAYDFLCSNPKVKFVYAGIKAYTLSDLNHGEYRPKTNYLSVSNSPVDVKGTLEDFIELIKVKFVPPQKLSFKAKGHFKIEFYGVSLKFAGFGSEKSIFIYADDNQRKAFQAIYCPEH